MIEKESNYIQQIYRIILFLIGLWFINLIWPYISDVILMLVFAFLFTTVLLSSVDAFERRIGNRGLSVLGVVIILFGGVSTFLGSFISQISQQAQDFSQRVDQNTMSNEFKILGEKITSALPSFMKTNDSSSDYFANKLTDITQAVLGSLGSLVSTVGNFMFIAVMVFIFTIILLSEYHTFKKALVNAIPNKYFEVGLKLIYNIEKSVSSYLRGQFLSAASVAGMSIAGLLLLISLEQILLW
jgi:Predicted permease